MVRNGTILGIDVIVGGFGGRERRAFRSHGDRIAHGTPVVQRERCTGHRCDELRDTGSQEATTVVRPTRRQQWLMVVRFAIGVPLVVAVSVVGIPMLVATLIGVI